MRKIVQAFSASLVCIMLIGHPVLAAAPSTNKQVSEQHTITVEEKQKDLCSDFIEQLNKYRKENGLDAVVYDKDLVTDAVIRSEEAHINFSHTRPDGTAWWTLDSDHMMAENLGMNYKSANAILNGWINSPTHNQNLLDSRMHRIGLGVLILDSTHMVWALEMGY